MTSKLILAAIVAAAPFAAFAGDTDTSADHSGHDHGAHGSHGEMAMADDGAMEMAIGDAPMMLDAYARAATPNARSGAAFGVLMNPTDVEDTLIAVRSDVAARIELHTHLMNDDGTMQMREVEGGFVIPAGGQHMLARGGDHIMFMGLKESFDQGKDIPVTLVFENAGEIETVITVDLKRKAEGMHGSHGDHGGHDHGEMSN